MRVMRQGISGFSDYLVVVLLVVGIVFSIPSALASRGVALKDPHSIRMILSLPLENRRQVLLSRYRPSELVLLLQPLIFNPSESMNLRWSALIGLAYSVDTSQSRSVVELALRHSTWFMRNAGLLSMEILDSSLSLQWADRLLDDPSLLVRTAAVDLIRRLKASQYKFRLLEKLNASDSFYKNKSLWIRKHIVQALAEFAEPGEKQFFTLLLKDPDPRLHSIATKVLEKLNGKKSLVTQSLIIKNNTP